MIVYFIFFAVIISLFSIDYAINNEKVGGLTYLAVFITLLFTVLRFETGYDYINYTRYFASDASSLIDRDIEFGFVGLVWLLKALGLGVYWLFFVFGLAITLLLYRGIGLYTNNKRLAFLIFLLVPGLFLNSFSIIRQSLAMVLLFNSFYYLMNKRYFVFTFYIVAAGLFHYSALLVIPFFLLFIPLNKYARWIMIIGIPLSLVLAQMNFFGKLLEIIFGSSKFALYFKVEGSSTNILKLIVLNVSVIPYFILYNRFSREERYLVILVVFGLMLINVFASVAPITRIGYYFKVFEIVLLANVANYFKKGLSQIIYCIVVVLYFFAIFYNSLSYDYYSVDEYPKMTPYQTIFEK